MPLLTEGKTNWKYISVILTLAILAGSGLVFFCKNGFSNPKVLQSYFNCPDGSRHGPGIPREGIEEWCKARGYIVSEEEKHTISEEQRDDEDQRAPLDRVEYYTYPSGRIASGEGRPTGKNIIERDLNGDGDKEEIQVRKVEDENIYFVLQIDDKAEKLDFWPTDFSVIDIEEEDKYQEIVLHNPGPSNDDVSLFLWYNDGEVKKVGEVSRWPTIFGDGEVAVGDWMGFWTKVENYILDEEAHKLEIIPKETYNVGIETIATDFFIIYKKKSEDSEIAREAEPGDEVKVLSAEGCDTYYCEWFQLEVEGVRGWVKQDDFDYKINISHAD